MPLLSPAMSCATSFADFTLVGHGPFDALGRALLEVLVVDLFAVAFGSGLDGLEARHAPDSLHEPSGGGLDLSRALFGPREHRADHDRGGTGGDRLGDVTGRPNSPICDDRHGQAVRVGDGAELGHADARHETSRAHPAGSDANLDRIGAGLAQVLSAGSGRDVARDHVGVGHGLFDASQRVDGVLGMAVGDVEHQSVTARAAKPDFARLASWSVPTAAATTWSA